MKKLFFTVFILSLFLLIPEKSVQASTASELRIIQIKAQIEALSAELALLQGSGDSSNMSVNVGNIFSQNLEGIIQNSVKITLESPAEIYVPMTTTDSSRNGLVGMAYSLIGDEFTGDQKSKFSCGKKKKISGVYHCVIAPNKPTKITLRVDLKSKYTGNYGVSFDQITYLKDGKYSQYKLPTTKSNLIFVGQSN